MIGNLPGQLGLPTQIAADTGQALVLLNTHTGHVSAHAGPDRDQWLAENRSPAPIAVAAAEAGWGTIETSACLPAAGTPPARWVPAAAAAIALTLAVRAVGPRRQAFGRLVALAHTATRRRATASRGEAQAALRAVRWIARAVPARMACLEESIAALITLAIRRRRADWRHGIASDPIRLHAWIEIHRQPIDEPASTSSYTPLIRIPAPAETEAETGGAR